jgi:hypothetical protein
MPPREPREPHRGGVLEFYVKAIPIAAFGLDRAGSQVARGMRDASSASGALEAASRGAGAGRVSHPPRHLGAGAVERHDGGDGDRLPVEL